MFARIANAVRTFTVTEPAWTYLILTAIYWTLAIAACIVIAYAVGPIIACIAIVAALFVYMGVTGFVIARY